MAVTVRRSSEDDYCDDYDLIPSMIVRPADDQWIRLEMKYSVLRTLYSGLCTQDSVPRTLYPGLRTLYSVLYTPSSIHALLLQPASVDTGLIRCCYTRNQVKSDGKW